MVTDPGNWRDGIEERWLPLFSWVESLVGGTIVGVRRQARWRPCWFIDLRTEAGDVKSVYLRCQREEGLPWTVKISVEREHRIMQVLQNNDVRIPRLLGFHPDPQAILMEVVPGRDRFDATDSQDVRDQVLAEYVEILARAHAIDTRQFADVGLHLPQSAEENGWGGFAQTEAWYRGLKTVPDPVNEFIVRWIHRNVPTHRERTSWVAWDAGQFLHEGGHCTALMDVEFSMIGDPLNDLAAMRFRDTIQPIGDLTKAFAHYAAQTGEPIDKRVLNFQCVRFSAVTSTLSLGERLNPPPEFDFVQWEAWSLVAQFVALEVIAEELGIELDESEERPVAAASRRRPWILSADRILSAVGEDLHDEFSQYRVRTAGELTSALLRADEIAADLEDRNRADEETLLGTRPSDWLEADQMLEDYVLGADPAADEKLVRFFHRRLRREELMLEPAMREMIHFRVQPIDWNLVPTV